MRKFFWFIFVVVMLVVQGCGGGITGKDAAKKIVGKWTYSEGVGKLSFTDTYVFREDGTLTFEDAKHAYANGVRQDGIKFDGTYSIVGNKITIILEERDDVFVEQNDTEEEVEETENEVDEADQGLEEEEDDNAETYYFKFLTPTRLELREVGSKETIVLIRKKI